MKTATTRSQADVLADIDASEIFTGPIGPTEQCLSTSQIVSMFESGARRDELQHLARCEWCRDVYARASQVERMLAIERSAPVAEEFGKKVKAIFGLGETKGIPSKVSAVLGLSYPELQVTDLEDDVSVTMELLPFSGSYAAEIDISSLRLKGAVTSESAVLQPGDDEELTTVTFEGGRLSKDVKRTLAGHARVADQIEVSGTLKGGGEALFLGQAKVHIMQPLRKSKSSGKD